MSITKLTFSTAFCLVLGASMAQAQATRTWVSGVGDDANPCSRTAPCKTFAGAISKTAVGGEIDAFDPGGFGAVTITKSVTIDGGGTFASILAASTNGINVNDSAGPTPGTAVVRIRNLSINGVSGGTSPGLNGIRFTSGAALFVENCQVANFTQKGIDFEPGSGNAQLFVSGTNVENAAGGGIFVKPSLAGSASARASLDGVMLVRNSFGLRAEDSSTVTVRNSLASQNGNNGFVAFSTSLPAQMNLEHSLATLNGSNSAQGGANAFGANAVLHISEFTSVGNTVGLLTTLGGSIVSFGNNRIGGNTIADGSPTSTVAQQ